MECRRMLVSCGMGVMLLLVPVRFSTLEAARAEPGSLVRIQEACGQAADCAPLKGYICSGPKEDKMDYTCSKGCNVSAD